MICATCLGPADDIEHVFVVGVIASPSKRWSIFAPQYFKASPDFRVALLGYCSAACSLASVRSAILPSI